MTGGIITDTPPSELGEQFTPEMVKALSHALCQWDNGDLDFDLSGPGSFYDNLATHLIRRMLRAKLTKSKTSASLTDSV